MYTPIDFLNDTNGLEKISDTEIFDIYRNHMDGIDTFDSITEFKRFVLSPEFLKDVNEGKHAKFNKFAYDFIPELVDMLNIPPKDLLNNKLQLITEYRDFLLSGFHFNEWAETKQVYKLDKDFCTALQNTEKIKMDKDVMTHLPINVFYLDLSSLDHPTIHGAFVLLDHDGNEHITITIYALTHDLIFFSHHMYFNFTEKDSMNVVKHELEENEPYILDAFKNRKSERMRLNNHDFSYRDLTTVILHTIMYLGSSEPDITENETTKKTYKPRKKGSPIKNKFSEVQMFDVGYKYGTAFRKKLKEYNIQRKDITYMNAETEKTRKSPVPHIRCAHWAHRWTGPKTDQHLKLVWIEPCFVGFGDIHKTDIATIHEVK